MIWQSIVLKPNKSTMLVKDRTLNAVKFTEPSRSKLDKTHQQRTHSSSWPQVVWQTYICSRQYVKIITNNSYKSLKILSTECYRRKQNILPYKLIKHILRSIKSRYTSVKQTQKFKSLYTVFFRLIINSCIYIYICFYNYLNVN